MTALLPWRTLSQRVCRQQGFRSIISCHTENHDGCSCFYCSIYIHSALSPHFIQIYVRNLVLKMDIIKIWKKNNNRCWGDASVWDSDCHVLNLKLISFSHSANYWRWRVGGFGRYCARLHRVTLALKDVLKSTADTLHEWNDSEFILMSDLNQGGFLGTSACFEELLKAWTTCKFTHKAKC